MKFQFFLLVSLFAIYSHCQMVPDKQHAPSMEMLDRDIAILKASIQQRLDYIKNFMTTAAKSHMNKMIDFNNFRFKEQSQQDQGFQKFIKNDDLNESQNEDFSGDENLNNEQNDKFENKLTQNNSTILSNQTFNQTTNNSQTTNNNQTTNDNATQNQINDRYLRFNTSQGVYDLLSNSTIRDDLVQIRGTSCRSLTECLQLNKKFYHFVRSALRGRDGINGKRGPRGPTGDQGPQGPQGDAGPNGYTPSREFIQQLVRSYVKQALFKLASNSLLYKNGILGAPIPQQPSSQTQQAVVQNSVNDQITPQLEHQQNLQQQKIDNKEQEDDKVIDDEQIKVVKTSKKQKKKFKKSKINETQ